MITEQEIAREEELAKKIAELTERVRQMRLAVVRLTGAVENKMKEGAE